MSKLPRVPWSLTEERRKMLASAAAILGTGDNATATIEACVRAVVTGRPSPQLALPTPSAPHSSPPSPGARLRAARIAAGLTQRALGDIVGGYSRATVDQCERGREMPDALREWLEAQEMERGS